MNETEPVHFIRDWKFLDVKKIMSSHLISVILFLFMWSY